MQIPTSSSESPQVYCLWAFFLMYCAGVEKGVPESAAHRQAAGVPRRQYDLAVAKPDESVRLLTPRNEVRRVLSHVLIEYGHDATRARIFSH